MSTVSMSVIFRKRSTSRRASRICEPRRIIVVLREGLSLHLDQIFQACRGFYGGHAKNLCSANSLTSLSHWSASRPYRPNRRHLGAGSDRHALLTNAIRKPVGFRPLERCVLCIPLNPPY